MSAAMDLRTEVGTVQACEAMGLARASFYRRLKPKAEPVSRPAPPLALARRERQAVVDLLNSSRFQDDAPRQVFAVLLDEGRYYCSIRTMYRILKEEYGDVKERRKQVRRPVYKKPELLATGSNEVWSWDISVLQQRMA